MSLATAATIISEAAQQLGLVSAAVDDPFGSRDTNLLQLCSLLQALGQDLLRDYKWTHLQKAYTFSTVVTQETYALPEDYDRIIDRTGWNRGTTMPLGGPLGAQSWQALQARSVGGVIGQSYRIVGGELELTPVPTAVEVVAFEYQSTWWVQEAGQDVPNTENLDAATDTPHFDRRLLVTGLKLAFLEAKGFDTTAAQQAFDRALARARGGDGGAPVLSLGGGLGDVHLLDDCNIPETGYGG